MIWAWLACTEDDGRGSHSGSPRAIPDRCVESPCVADLASAIADDPGEGDEGGQVVVATSEWVFVGAPGVEVLNHVGVYSLPQLDWVGSWEGHNASGMELLVEDVTGDSRIDLLIGRPRDVADGRSGSVTLMNRPPLGAEDLETNAALTVQGPDWVRLGNMAIADADGDGGKDLIVSGLGRCCSDGEWDPGGLFVFDPSLRGVVSMADAKRHFTSDYLRWGHLRVHDIEGDGRSELWEGNRLFAHALPLIDAIPDYQPLVDDLTPDAFNETHVLGDVTGDGLADLATFFLDHPDEDRQGVLYLLPGGFDQATPVDASPLTVRGTRTGDAMGVAAVSADITGDGVLDLVVGAAGAYPGVDLPGRVLVFPGPVDGHLTEEDVVGEYPGDYFGRALAVTDVDGDDQDDLVVGAQGYPAGYSDGRVYVVPGAALVPRR